MATGLLVLLLSATAAAIPEMGFYVFTLDNQNSAFQAQKHMYTKSMVSVSVSCKNEEEINITITWHLRLLSCSNSVFPDDKEQIIKYLTMPYSYEDGSSMPVALIVKNFTHPCGKNTLPFQLPDSSNEKPQYIMNQANKNAPMQQKSHSVVPTTWTDGLYLFILYIQPATSGTEAPFTANVKVSFTWEDNNYISATDYPLLIFYGILGLVYIFYGLIWLMLLVCNLRDLLHVHFWIGGVILLGLIETAVFSAEYKNINRTGVSVLGTLILAELVSSLMQALVRMLIIIISLGFGIVKPCLRQAYYKVLFVGGLYFVLSSIEGSIHVTNPQVIQSNQYLLVEVPLAVLGLFIWWWIISSLNQTRRTLKLCQNVVKLTSYQHFTNALIFAMLASSGYLIWFMTQYTFTSCIKNWEELWVTNAYWHLINDLLLFIIMLLWRPTANSQRYAFSPLLDTGDDKNEETIMNDAFEGKQSIGSPKSQDNQDSKAKMEEDLKWVEEHAPSSVADNVSRALPSLLPQTRI